jgi:hypothetical protein
MNRRRYEQAWRRSAEVRLNAKKQKEAKETSPGDFFGKGKTFFCHTAPEMLKNFFKHKYKEKGRALSWPCLSWIIMGSPLI